MKCLRDSRVENLSKNSPNGRALNRIDEDHPTQKYGKNPGNKAPSNSVSKQLICRQNSDNPGIMSSSVLEGASKRFKINSIVDSRLKARSKSDPKKPKNKDASWKLQEIISRKCIDQKESNRSPKFSDPIKKTGSSLSQSLANISLIKQKYLVSNKDQAAAAPSDLKPPSKKQSFLDKLF